MYSKQSFSRLNQTTIANDLRKLLQKSKGSEVKIKEQSLIITNKNQTVANIKIFQPSPKTKTRISETRK